jgi:hypothetical protein
MAISEADATSAKLKSSPSIRFWNVSLYSSGTGSSALSERNFALGIVFFNNIALTSIWEDFFFEIRPERVICIFGLQGGKIIWVVTITASTPKKTLRHKMYTLTCSYIKKYLRF